MTASSGASGVVGSFTLTGLSPSTLYMVNVVLARDAQGANLLPTMNWDQNGVPVASSPLVVSTLAESADRAEQVRPLLANRALNFFDGSQHGDFKEGLKACNNCGNGNEWCSEFYNACTSPWFDSMLVTGTTQATTDSVIGAFKDYGGTYTNLQPQYYIEEGYAGMGDYLPLGANGCASHSTMFLAWDSTIGQYWYVDGNDNDRVLFHAMAPGSVNVGLGHLTDAMLR